MQATWYFQSFWSTFMRRLGDIRLEDDEGFPLCRRLPRQGFPPAPPQGVPCLEGLGGMGPIRALGTWEWPLP